MLFRTKNFGGNECEFSGSWSCVEADRVDSIRFFLCLHLFSGFSSSITHNFLLFWSQSLLKEAETHFRSDWWSAFSVSILDSFHFEKFFLIFLCSWSLDSDCVLVLLQLAFLVWQELRASYANCWSKRSEEDFRRAKQTVYLSGQFLFFFFHLIFVKNSYRFQVWQNDDAVWVCWECPKIETIEYTSVLFKASLYGMTWRIKPCFFSISLDIEKDLPQGLRIFCIDV